MKNQKQNKLINNTVQKRSSKRLLSLKVKQNDQKPLQNKTRITKKIIKSSNKILIESKKNQRNINKPKKSLKNLQQMPKNETITTKKKQLKRLPIQSKKTPLFEHFKNLYLQKSNDYIKEFLQINLQSKSGNKDQLAEKAAFLKCYGSIPRCPKCHGGHLKFDFATDHYFCKGFYDDTDMIKCNSTFKFTSIQLYKTKESGQ